MASGERVMGIGFLFQAAEANRLAFFQLAVWPPFVASIAHQRYRYTQRQSSEFLPMLFLVSKY
jgi:hypothetical protein